MLSSARHWPVAATLLLVLFSACATSDGSSSSPVDVRIEQLPDAGLSVEDRGFLSVAYQLTVRNRSTDPITLQRIAMKTVRNSCYSLRDEAVALTETIETGQEAIVPISMWRTAGETRSTVRDLVWVSGTLEFTSAQGTFKRSFMQSFREP
jgi:hypothetical protein